MEIANAIRKNKFKLVFTKFKYMEYKVNVGGKVITLIHDNIEETINVDNLTKIDPSNLYGEAVTISAAMNRVGLLRAELQELLDRSKLEIKVYESDFIARKRKEAASNGGKFKMRIGNDDFEVKVTERALEKVFETDPKWIKLKTSYIELERDFNRLDSLYWSCQSKDKKLSNLTNSVTPEEFSKELVEGKFNGITVKK